MYISAVRALSTAGRLVSKLRSRLDGGPVTRHSSCYMRTSMRLDGLRWTM